MMKRGRHAGKSCRVSAAAVKQFNLIVSCLHRPLIVLAIIVLSVYKSQPCSPRMHSGWNSTILAEWFYCNWNRFAGKVMMLPAEIPDFKCIIPQKSTDINIYCHPNVSDILNMSCCTENRPIVWPDSWKMP